MASPTFIMPVAKPQDENINLYRRVNFVCEYAKVELHPPEAVVLVRYRDDIQDRRVLDLGCGAGRLATYLRPLTHDYVGADISQYMVDYCQSCFQGLAFHQADMRQLPFQAGSFDSVFAICNLFDAVSHEERLQVLAEARRILAPGGLLVFSAHNRNWQYAGDGPRLHVRLNPVSQLRSLAEYCKSQVNHHRLKTVHRQEKDYALLSDEGHQFAMLHYYVTRDCQARQLADAGFRLLECLDENGQTLSPGDDDRANSCIHYVARSA